MDDEYLSSSSTKFDSDLDSNSSNYDSDDDDFRPSNYSPPQIIKTFPEKIFCFKHPHTYLHIAKGTPVPRKFKCTVKIIVKELRYYDGKEVYDITYQWPQRPGGYKKKCFIWPNITEDDSCTEGEIIVKNFMTTSLVEMLVMPFSEMKPLTGLTRPCDYKRQIMQFISKLYD